MRSKCNEKSKNNLCGMARQLKIDCSHNAVIGQIGVFRSGTRYGTGMIYGYHVMPVPCLVEECYPLGTMAMGRTGLPLPWVIFRGDAMRMAPRAGSFSRLFSWVKPYFPLPCMML